MDKNSGATNEVTEDNIKAVKEFLRAVEQLYKDTSTIQNLHLETKAAALLTELYAVEKLYDEYHENYKIYWLGGGKRYRDIELINKETGKHYGVQVKKATNSKKIKNVVNESYESYSEKKVLYWLIRHDSWSNYGERTKEGYLQLDVNKVKEGDVKLHKKLKYPFVFVWLEDIGNPQFFVYSREEMSNSWDQLVSGHNAFLRKHWEDELKKEKEGKHVKKDGNTINTSFWIDPIGHEGQFDKIFV